MSGRNDKIKEKGFNIIEGSRDTDHLNQSQLNFNKIRIICLSYFDVILILLFFYQTIRHYHVFHL